MSVFAGDAPSVWTDKADYGALDVVQVSGQGFALGAALTVAITRPDGTVITGDGSGTPGTDAVTADADGALTYQYALSGVDAAGNAYVGQEDTYVLDVLDASGVVLASTTFTDSHFRFGHMTWKKIGTNEAEITYIFAARTSFYGSLTIGASVLIAETIDFGDSSSVTPAYTVTDIDTGSDWFQAKAVVTHQYASAGPFTAFNTSGSRIGGLVNSPSANWRVETDIDFGTSGSPVSLLPAIVDCPLGGTCTFTIGASQPDLHDITYRLAVIGESSATQPTGSSIDATTGVYSLDTTSKADGSLWTSQVILEDRDSGGSVISTSALDFIIRLVDASAPPAFDVPPTPANGTTLGVSVGQTLNFSVKATDSDSATVTISSLGVPAAATFAAQTGTNPGTRTFSWTPTISDVGVISIVFTATDGETTVIHSVTINVSKLNLVKTLTHVSGPNPPEIGATSEYDISIAASLIGAAPESVISVTVTDPLPTGVTYVGNTSTTAGTISFSAPDVEWTSIGTFAPGGSATGSFRVSITPVAGDLGNTIALNDGAVITGTEQTSGLDLSALSNTLSTSAVVAATQTLTVTKAGTGAGTVTSSPSGINCGGTCSFAFTAGTAVTLTATLSTGSSFAGWSGAGCSGTGTCGVTMSSAQSVTATFDLGNADLAITKTATPTEARVGQNLDYTLTVTNNGPDDATSITVTDTLPSTVAWVSDSSACAHTGEPLGGTVTCTAASLADGASIAFTITVTAPNATGSLSNTATVSANETDATASNDSVTLVTSVLGFPPVPAIGAWGLGALALVFGAFVFVARKRRAAAGA